MTMYSVTLRGRLDRVPGDEVGPAVGRRWAEQGGAMLASTTYGIDAHRFGVVGAVRDVDDPIGLVAEQAGVLVDVLAGFGLTMQSWEMAEVADEAEINRRLNTPSIPPMVSAAELAALCGVSTQRIYELDGDRRKAEEQGGRHAFPAPVVPGYWLKTMAETYAATRKRKPGPAAKSA